MNSAAVDRGVDAAVKINVPESWKTLADDTKAPDASLPHYIREIQIPCQQAGRRCHPRERVHALR